MHARRPRPWYDCVDPCDGKTLLKDKNSCYGGYCCWCIKPIPAHNTPRIVHVMRSWDEWTISMGTWRFDKDKDRTQIECISPESLPECDDRIKRTLTIVDPNDSSNPNFIKCHPHTLMLQPYTVCDKDTCASSVMEYLFQEHPKCDLCETDMKSFGVGNHSMLYHIASECPQRICWRCERPYALLDGKDLITIASKIGTESSGTLAAIETGRYRPLLLEHLKVLKNYFRSILAREGDMNVCYIMYHYRVDMQYELS
jgi:hypothetical protein